MERTFVRTRTLTLIIALAGSMAALIPASADTARWSEAKAEAWYTKQPWLVGSNYTPATAINELEMWQADTFDPPPSTRNSAGPKASA